MMVHSAASGSVPTEQTDKPVPARHTPGPWAVASMGWGSGSHRGGQVHAMVPTGRYIKTDDGFVPEPVTSGTPVCSFFTSGYGYGATQGAANARLIAAAPDMLEALTGLLGAYRALVAHVADDEFDIAADHPASWASKADDAIAKALGES